MEFIVIGSGGASPSPRPCCQCRVCKAARKGGKDFRTGPCLFLRDEAILFDTPEELRIRLNEENITEVKHVFYTHWHPDHSQGMRVFEHMMKVPEGVFRPTIKPQPTTVVHLPRAVYDEFLEFQGKATLTFYEKRGFIKINILEDDEKTTVGNVTITPLALPRKARYAYIIESGGKKLLYAPCSIFGIKPVRDVDVCLLELGWLGDTKKLREGPEDDIRLWHVSFEENLDFVCKSEPGRAIVTHIEEAFSWPPEYIPLKHDEIVQLCSRHGVDVAYDGMEISL